MSSAATAEAIPTTLVIGLGNPLRGDDGVGWAVVDALRAALATGGGDPGAVRPSTIGSLELDRLAVGGLTLMERLVGADRVVLVDAMAVTAGGPGTVSCRLLDEVPARASAHLDSAHDTSLPSALQAGKALGASLPREIWVVGVEILSSEEFVEGLSPAVAAAVPVAVTQVAALLGTA